MVLVSVAGLPPAEAATGDLVDAVVETDAGITSLASSGLDSDCWIGLDASSTSDVADVENGVVSTLALEGASSTVGFGDNDSVVAAAEPVLSSETLGCNGGSPGAADVPELDGDATDDERDVAIFSSVDVPGCVEAGVEVFIPVPSSASELRELWELRELLLLEDREDLLLLRLELRLLFDERDGLRDDRPGGGILARAKTASIFDSNESVARSMVDFSVR